MLVALSTRYQLLRLIRRGGNAELFEAQQLGAHGFKRRVALKRLLKHPQVGDHSAFAEEARILSQLDHPNIVKVQDFGLMDDQPFQILEFVDGDNLAALVEKGRAQGRQLGTTRALYVVAMVARGLDYAHAARDEQNNPLHLVHRDISPENILVSWKGEVKLADFGIALMQGGRRATEAGWVKGKPAFMAPEQSAGQAVTPHADIYALGRVLQFCTPDSTQTDLLPEDVQRIVNRACAPSPQARYDRASQLAQECEEALRTRGEHRPETSLSRWLERLQQAPRAASPLEQMFELELLDELSADALPQYHSVAHSAPELPPMPDLEAIRTVRDPPTIEQTPPPQLVRSEAGSTLVEPEPSAEFTDIAATYVPRPLEISAHYSLRRDDGSTASYVLLASLGAVGGGELYIAQLQGSTQLRTLKYFEGRFAEPERCRAVLDEAELMSAHANTNLLKILDHGLIHGRPAVIFEYLAGRPLRRVLQDARLSGGLSRAQRLGIAIGALRGLRSVRAGRAAWSSKLKDAPIALKLEHIFVTHSGVPKLTSFGFRSAAEQLDEGAQLSDGPQTEQAAFGAMLFELISGRAPAPALLVAATAKTGAPDAALDRLVAYAMDLEPRPRWISQLEGELMNYVQAKQMPPFEQVLIDLMRKLYGSNISLEEAFAERYDAPAPSELDLNTMRSTIQQAPLELLEPTEPPPLDTVLAKPPANAPSASGSPPSGPKVSHVILLLLIGAMLLLAGVYLARVV